MCAVVVVSTCCIFTTKFRVFTTPLSTFSTSRSQSLLVDNSPHAYSYHIDNGIPIESWYDDDSDTELLKLIGFLKSVQNVDDVRPIVREHFKTYHLIDRARNGLSVSLSAPPF